MLGAALMWTLLVVWSAGTPSVDANGFIVFIKDVFLQVCVQDIYYIVYISILLIVYTLIMK